MTVDFSAIPSALAEALTISEYAAELMVSIFVVGLILCVVAVFTREPITLIIFVFLGLTLDIAMGWLDYFVLIFALLVVALLYANNIKNMLSGGG